MGFHNHAGYIGCQLWDFAPVIDSLDPKWVGYYYDLENAAEEGGAQGWRIDANLAMPRLKMLAAKDVYWKKTEAEGWRATTCPLGEGMCNTKFCCGWRRRMDSTGRFLFTWNTRFPAFPTSRELPCRELQTTP